jgi:hypothetical protein
MLLKKDTRPQEIVQSARTTPNEAKVTSLNPPHPFCADMSKKKKGYMSFFNSKDKVEINNIKNSCTSYMFLKK